jgi:hypothetical protein
MTFPAMAEPENSKVGAADTEQVGEPDLLAMAETDPQAVVDHMRGEWDRSVEDKKNWNEQWKVNLSASEGFLGARLNKVQDRQEAWLPEGAEPSIVGLDKANRLGERLKAAMFADEPLPNVIPDNGADASADSAEFQTRILKDEAEKLKYVKRAKGAFSVGKDYGSGFLHFYIDSQGRGPEPVRIKAHPDALSPDNPMLEAEIAAKTAEPKAPTLRYITAEDEATETPAGLTDERYGKPLKHQFLPKLCCEVLNGRHVSMLPGTSCDLDDARGVLVGAMVPLGNVKAAYKSVADMDDAKLAELVSYRPSKAKDLLPVTQRKFLQETKVSDSTLVFLLLRYHLPTATNQKGSYFAAVGDNHLAHFGVWWDEEHDERLDLPLTQFLQYHEEGNPYGAGSMQKLGPGNEILALILDAMFMHMDRFGDQKTFVPMNSSLRPEQLEAESHRYIPFAGGAPVVESIPDFPVIWEKMYARIAADMDDESGLQQAGQALQSPSIKSAVHFESNVQQVQVLLSDLRQNTASGLERGWLVMSQLIRAFYTIPQFLRMSGEDGVYRYEEWSGEDMIGAGDVKIAQGSFSGQTPDQKAMLARSLYLQDKILTPQEYKRIVTHQFDAQLALQDDPHYQRVKGQLSKWQKGPPEGWAPPQPQVDPMTGQPVVNPATGQPVVPPDPVLGQIFAPRPVDSLPAVAQMRCEEIGRALASSKIDRFPPEWVQPLFTLFEQTRQAAGIVTIAEQQQAAAQQAQAAAQDKALDREAKHDIEAAKIASGDAKVQSATEQQALDRAMKPPMPQAAP